MTLLYDVITSVPYIFSPKSFIKSWSALNFLSNSIKNVMFWRKEFTHQEVPTNKYKKIASNNRNLTKNFFVTQWPSLVWTCSRCYWKWRSEDFVGCYDPMWQKDQGKETKYCCTEILLYLETQELAKKRREKLRDTRN